MKKPILSRQNPNVTRLPDELSAGCEGEINLQDISGSFHTGKTPGNDGIPVEFYKTFWPLLGRFMVDSFNEAFNQKEMSHSQKQAIITLIEKKGKDRNYLENRRPISLINVDAKIASKVIAARVIKVLPEINYCNQTGYVKARENEVRERIPHTCPSSYENSFQSIFVSASCGVAILMSTCYWSVRVTSFNFKLCGGL